MEKEEILSLAKAWDNTIDDKFWSVISKITDMLPEGEYKLEKTVKKIQKRMKFPLDYKTYYT